MKEGRKEKKRREEKSYALLRYLRGFLWWMLLGGSKNGSLIAREECEPILSQLWFDMETI